MRRLVAAGAALCTLLLALAFLHIQSPHARVKAEDGEVEKPEDDAPRIEEPVGGLPAGLTTDAEVVQREAESISARHLRSQNSQKFDFQAEVSRLMDIIINSLYSNKDVFLRELISNASDALDKIRFLSLTDKTVLGEGNDAKLDIHIKLDKVNNILTIRDRGVGMTKEDLIKNLGTIAKSGTSAFLEQVQQGGDLNLIGQFGVGFYSVYLVADYVEVISKHNDDKQYIWESKADGKFAVIEDTENEPLGRGTEIRIHLKKDASELYAEETKLRELVKKYSEFIDFPIYLWASKEVDVEALWLRNAKDVTPEEYDKFYHSFTKDLSADKPMAWTHFNAEGDVEFKAVLFIPPTAAPDLFENYYINKATLKLYVRRVFISDTFDELLPKYLSFLKGIVDSDSLPLNVSREMLQQHASLKTIKKKLVRKALDMIRHIADEDPDEKLEAEESSKAIAALKSHSFLTKGKYAKFWEQFSKVIKLGIIEDAMNHDRLAKLLRFHSSKSGDKLISLDQYIVRMKPGQKQIYYITGQDKKQLEKSPLLENLLKRGYEILFLTDPIDEYLTQNLTEYEGNKFQNASKDDLKIGRKYDQARTKEIKESYKELTKWWKDILAGENVESVKVSNRLANTPAVVVTSKYGWSANMERIMKSQTLSEPAKLGYMGGKRILEINPRHPIIKELREKVALDSEDESAKEAAKLIFETALLESGFVLEDPKDFATRIYSVIKSNLNVRPDAEVDVDDDDTEDEVEKEEADMDFEIASEDKNDNPQFNLHEETMELGDMQDAQSELPMHLTSSREPLKDEL
ncbi:unnamed protein product [Sphagnum jensenii]|uniref:Histidine kinase/HSP90-like ATPase domain-containing protein n=1 Tax=Sphagnum jensenii TaxID=128206 RepID=A0ABP1A731_9BRYO